jgi:hypothetical protein
MASTAFDSLAIFLQGQRERDATVLSQHFGPGPDTKIHIRLRVLCYWLRRCHISVSHHLAG